MSQDYKVLELKIGNFQDNYGNTWCDMVLEGVGEPVRIVLKDPTTVKAGDTLYGHIEQAISKANKAYNRFKKDQLPENAPDPQTPVTTHSAPAVDWDAKDRAIRAQFAIKAAIAYGTPETPLADIEASAKAFYAMVDRVAGSNTQDNSEMPEDFLKGIEY